MHARFVRVDYILDHYYLACIVVIGLVINMIESYYANDPVTCYVFARVCCGYFHVIDYLNTFQCKI